MPAPTRNEETTFLVARCFAQSPALCMAEYIPAVYLPFFSFLPSRVDRTSPRRFYSVKRFPSKRPRFTCA